MFPLRTALWRIGTIKPDSRADVKGLSGAFSTGYFQFRANDESWNKSQLSFILEVDNIFHENDTTSAFRRQGSAVSERRWTVHDCFLLPKKKESCNPQTRKPQAFMQMRLIEDTNLREMMQRRKVKCSPPSFSCAKPSTVMVRS